MSLADTLDTGDLPLLAVIPDDRGMSLNDMKGESVFALDENSAILKGVEKALLEIGIK